MQFPTIDFGVFFLIVFFISWAIKKQRALHKLFLIAASYAFYLFFGIASGSWRFTLLLFCLLFGCSAANYVFALVIDRANVFYSLKRPEQGVRPKKSPLATAVLVIAVILNLGLLAYFKYYYFLTTNLNSAFLVFGLAFRLPSPDITLPLGVSFIAFQALAYTVDVYRGAWRADRSFIDVLLFHSFFPRLVAGPIVRAGEFLPQVKEEPSLDKVEFARAAGLIAFGLLKKVFIANYVGTQFVDPVFENPGASGGLELLCGAYGYAVQIFCDFSAYSDMAVGFALLLGFRLPENFNQPYRASSLREFWRRWHISLSTWLRDYLYIPLGGSRKGRLAAALNLVLTMLLGGLWHGAAWNYLIWGGLQGVGLAAERFGREALKKARGGREIPAALRAVLKAAGVVLTFHFICLGWIFFRAPTLELALRYLGGVFSGGAGFQRLTPFLLALIGLGLLIHFLPRAWSDRLRRLAERLPLPLLAAGFAAFLIVLSALSPPGVAPFIYFGF